MEFIDVLFLSLILLFSCFAVWSFELDSLKVDLNNRVEEDEEEYTENGWSLRSDLIIRRGKLTLGVLEEYLAWGREHLDRRKCPGSESRGNGRVGHGSILKRTSTGSKLPDHHLRA